MSASGAGFSCTYPYTLGGTASGTVSIVGVSVAAGDGFDRIVVTFDGDAIPPIRLDAVTPPFTSDPSGLPLSVSGRSFVRLVMTGASGVGTYGGPVELALDGRPMQAFVEQGDFEAVTSWIAGLASPSCMRVTTLANPTRLVIDLREP